MIARGQTSVCRCGVLRAALSSSVFAVVLLALAVAVAGGCDRTVHGANDAASDAGPDGYTPQDGIVGPRPRDAGPSDIAPDLPPLAPSKDRIAFFHGGSAHAGDRLTLATIRGHAQNYTAHHRELTLRGDLQRLGVPSAFADLRRPRYPLGASPRDHGAIDLGAHGRLWQAVHADATVGGPHQLLVVVSETAVPRELLRQPICASCAALDRRLAVSPIGDFVAVAFGPREVTLISTANASWNGGGSATIALPASEHLLPGSLALTSQALYLVSYVGAATGPQPGDPHHLWRVGHTPSGVAVATKLPAPTLPGGTPASWIGGGEGLIPHPTQDRVLFTAGNPSSADGVADLPQEVLFLAVDGKLRRVSGSLTRLAAGADRIAHAPTSDLVAFVELDPLAGPTIRVELPGSSTGRAWAIRPALGAAARVEGLALATDDRLVVLTRASDAPDARRAVHVRDAYSTATPWQPLPLTRDAEKLWLLPHGQLLVLEAPKHAGWWPDARLFDIATLKQQVSVLGPGAIGPTLCGPGRSLLALPGNPDTQLVLLDLDADASKHELEIRPPVGSYLYWRPLELACSPDGRHLALVASYRVRNGNYTEKTRRGVFVLELDPMGTDASGASAVLRASSAEDGSTASDLLFSEQYLYYLDFPQLRALPLDREATPTLIYGASYDMFPVAAATAK
jgi:hypothetical protein